MGRRNPRFQLNFNVVEQAGSVKGRAKEIAALKKLYYDCASASKVVILEGKAGVGKTALLTSNTKLFTSSGHFVSGTFDHQRTAEPFSAIGDAMDELFEELLSADAEAKHGSNGVVKEIVEQFQKESKNDAGIRAVLQNAFPKFTELIQAAKDEKRHQKASLDTSSHHGSAQSKRSNNKRSVSPVRKIPGPTQARPARNSSGGYKKGWNFEKLKISLRLLLRCICKSRRRVVMLLDDLQYADPSSFEMIEFLASGDGLSTVPVGGSGDAAENNSDNNNMVQGLLLFLGFRNEKNAKPGHSICIDHPFRQRLKELKMMKCPIHRIHVKDLPLDAVNDMIAVILGYTNKPQTTMPLAQIVYKKTAGNPDSVIRMLEFLEHEDLVYFSLNEYQWEWKDVRTIHSATDLSDNIADIVAIKLQKLPPATQEILKLGSCLGNYFRLEVVAAYFRRYNARFHKIDFAQASRAAKIVPGVALEPLGQICEEDGEEEDEGFDEKKGKSEEHKGSVHMSTGVEKASTLMEQMIELLQLPLKQDMLTKRRKSTTYFFAHGIGYSRPRIPYCLAMRNLEKRFIGA